MELLSKYLLTEALKYQREYFVLNALYCLNLILNKKGNFFFFFKSLLVIQGGALLGAINALHTSFPENPMAQYRAQCELILERLELQDLLHKELQRLDRLEYAE